MIGIALLAWGAVVANGRGSADERVAGAFPIMAGLGFIVLGFVIALAWLLIRA
ncbi:hypothetical protein [Methylobacterium sp. SI9]|uniref:hypothetical protein n=1 Tax=Methylobacterium guangdongense TaxID=3138811 RepID=UPI00313CD129